MTALEAHVDVSAERGGAAAQDGPECLQLLIAEAGRDSVPGTGGPAHGGCRPPPCRAGSWVLGTPEGAAARHIRVFAALQLPPA